jgi:hypothetical protein
MPDYHHTVIFDATPFGEFTKRCKSGQLSYMDIQAIRRRNLRAHLNGAYGGNMSRLAAAADQRSPSYFSDLLRGERSKKSFGEKIARKLEKQLGLATNSLDIPNDDETLNVAEGVQSLYPVWPFSFDRERFDRLSAAQKTKIDGIVEGLIISIETEANRRRRKKRG